MMHWHAHEAAGREGAEERGVQCRRLGARELLNAVQNLAVCDRHRMDACGAVSNGRVRVRHNQERE